MRRLLTDTGLVLLGASVFSVLLFKHIAYPVLWQDEAETAVFAERVIEYGYPKVHGTRNVVYEFGGNVAVGVKESLDAYIGTTWGHFYFAVPGALWARTTSDRYARTARMRLPFAIAGAAGILCWIAALLPVVRDRPGGAARFAGLFLLLAAGSISLLLHLREVRYYPLLVLLTAALAWVELRHRVFAPLGPWRRGLLSALLLVAVFHTWFAAFFVLATALLLDAGWQCRAAESRLRAFAVESAPVWMAGLAVAPALVFFETFTVAASFREQLGITAAGFAANLAFAAGHFLRHEWLAAVLVARVAVLGLGARLRRQGRVVASAARQAAARLSAVALLWWVATCANPLVYERYFVPLVPVAIGIFLLDGFTLSRMLAQLGPPLRRRLGVALAIAIGAVMIVTGSDRAADLRGRWIEISHPYRGPLDVLIAHIAERESDPEQLVIATNYANHPLMYYLGSHVIVGTNLNNIVAERKLDPDWVVPRRRWPRGQAELRAFLARGNYEREVLPVRDTHFNNVPALTRSASTPDVHRFVSPVVPPGGDGDGLAVFRRAR